jgi:hypothetical protein
VSISPLTEDGKLYNPAGAYAHHDSAILISWRGRISRDGRQLSILREPRAEWMNPRWRNWTAGEFCW